MSIERASDGRIESLKIPMPKSVKPGSVQAAAQGVMALNPKAVKQTVQRGMQPRYKLARKPRKPEINWPATTRMLNNLLDPSKTGGRERAKFVIELPKLWAFVVEHGTQEQRDWVRKRIQKFAKKFGIDLPELPEPAAEEVLADELVSLTGERLD